MLSESVLLAIFGGLAGVALAWWGTSSLVALGPKELPRAHEVRIDVAVLLYAFIVSVFAGLLFGVVPALRASRIRTNR